MQTLTPKTLQSTLFSIKKNIEGIRAVTASTVIIQKNQQLVQKRNNQEEYRKKKEDKLESFKSFLGNKKEQISSNKSSLGLIDYIKNFATFVFFGFILKKLLPYLPKLKIILPALTWLGNAFNWITDLIGNSVVTFIDTAYKAQDTLRGVAKSVGGTKFEKTFNDFTKNFNTFLSLAVLGGLAAAGSGIIPKVLGKGLDKVLGKGVTETGKAIGKGASKITTSGGEVVAKVGGKAAPKLLGKSGKFLGKLAGRSAPIIGPLINFGIRVWSGDDPGKAAAGSVGMGIGQVIGGFLGGALGGIVGSVVPILGNALVGAAGIFVGSLIGAVIGEWIGDSLYDFATSGNKKPNKKIQGRAGGGAITRNGVAVGGKIKRTVKPTRKSLKRPAISKSIPGKNVGGKKIEKIFPNPQDDKKVNPLKTLTYAAQKYNSISLVGGLLRSGVEGAMGQSMDPNVMKNFATNIGTLVQNIVDGNIKSTSTGLNGNILAMASGGLVPDRTAGLNQPNIGEQVGTLLTKSLNLMVNNKMNDIFQNIMKEYDKQDVYSSVSSTPTLDEINDSYGSSTIGQVGNGVQKGVVVAQMLMNDLGISAAAAAGIVGNFLHESAGMNPSEVQGEPYGKPEKPPAVGTRNVGYGWAQWTNGRLDSFLKSYGGDKGKLATDQDNYNYLIKELRGQEPIRGIPEDDPTKAASWFRKEWERAGVPADGPRIQYAKQVFDKLKSVKNLKGDKWNAPSLNNLSTEQVTGGKLPSQIQFMSAQGWRWGKMHKGVDISGGLGSPISTSLNADVIQASDIGDGYGKVVILRYSNGSEARFAHLDKINVRRGQKLTAGTLIGTEGSTGQSTGPHLHFEYYPKGGAITYQGYGNAQAAMNSLFRYGGNVRPKVLTHAKDDADHDHDHTNKIKPGITLKNPKAEDINQKIINIKSGEKFDVIHKGNRYTVKKTDAGTEVYGPNGRVSNEEFSKSLRGNTPQPAKISAVPQSNKINAQSIAMYDSTTTRTQTVVAYQQVIQQTQVPVGSRGGLFPGETINVNTDTQLQAKALA